jgi:hypothetical protein
VAWRWPLQRGRIAHEAATMAAATRSDIVAALGPVDELTIAEIIGMGATCEELAEASAWIANDEALMNLGRPLAHGRVSRLVEIMAALREAEMGSRRQTGDGPNSTLTTTMPSMKKCHQ